MFNAPSNLPRAAAAALALALFGALPGAALAGPWVKAPGAGYAKAYTSLYRTGEHQIASPTGLQYVEGVFVGSYTGIYAEVGVAPRLMATANVPFVFARNTDEGGERYTNRGVGDVEVARRSQDRLVCRGGRGWRRHGALAVSGRYCLRSLAVNP